MLVFYFLLCISGVSKHALFNVVAALHILYCYLHKIIPILEIMETEERLKDWPQVYTVTCCRVGNKPLALKFEGSS